jgi:hypothetical protein
MSRFYPAVGLAIMTAWLLSCSTLSPEARKANINDTAYHIVVADRTLVDSWTAQYTCAYGPAAVGALAANELAEKGWHDVWVLVELVSMGMPDSVHLDITRMYTWRISIYR